MRRAYIVWIAVAVVVVLVVSALLARVWSAEAAERTAIGELIKDEARGDQSAALARIDGCAANPPCRARVAADVAALRRPGAVAILQLLPSTGFALGATLGTARVAARRPERNQNTCAERKFRRR